MTAEHPDADIVDGAHRAAQQLIFTVTQMVESVARMRQAAATRRADAARADAARGGGGDVRAAAGDSRVGELARRRADRADWTPAGAASWRAAADPADLLTAWAAATTWAAHDPRAADVMLRTEDEMRGRWPQVLDRYDRHWATDGLHPAAAMAAALTEATAAGWDPTTNAGDRARAIPEPPTPEPAAPGQVTGPVTAAAGSAAPIPLVVPIPPAAAPAPLVVPIPAVTAAAPVAVSAPAAAATRPAVVAADSPAAQALRWIPAAGTARAGRARTEQVDDHRPGRAPSPAPHLGR